MSTTKPYIIVLGNEKGGTGKSTVSMHLIVQLLKMGFTVGSMDLDARQGTLTRYVANRRDTARAEKYDTLCMPQHVAIKRSDNRSVDAAEQEETVAFEKAMSDLAPNHFIVIDTPGNDTYLSRLAHSHADTLITPLNDSFVDLDLLVQIDQKDGKITNLKPSTYAEAVWEQKKVRLMRDKVTVDWIVVRNRLSNLYARNKEEVTKVLNLLAPRLGFRIASGFGERVVFRELFLSGLTLLDLEEIGKKLSTSHLAARQELRNLLKAFNLASLASRVKLVDQMQKKTPVQKSDATHDGDKASAVATAQNVSAIPQSLHAKRS